MGAKKKTTVYLEPEILKAAKLRAVDAEESLAEYLRKAVLAQLAEDYEDIETFKSREKEPTVTFEKMMAGLKKRGLV